MRFSERLTGYMEELGVNGKKLSEASGLSAATISRYCSGTREPAADSAQFEKLAAGIAALAERCGVRGMDEASVRTSLGECLEGGAMIDYRAFIERLNSLMKNLDIRASELARGIYSDPSYLSKILSGSRKPGNLSVFIDDVTSYISGRFSDSGSLSSLMQFIGGGEDVKSSSDVKAALSAWFSSGGDIQHFDSMPRFLNSMDTFDLDDYLASVHYNELKVPPAMPHLPTRKEYTGIRRMMESDLDFMKTTVLSKSMDDVTLYSDMPIEEMAADPEFPKKYLFGFAMMLKKGLHINFIHDIDRPFSEMMMGLESYIPMYMTGQISPYYMPAANSSVFNHLLKVSGAAALEGYAITGKQSEGKYVLYRSKDYVAHYRMRAEALLGKAQPLMDIFTEERLSAYTLVMDRLHSGLNLRLLVSNLPLYFLSRESFEEMMKDLPVSAGDAERLRRYYDKVRERFLAHIGKTSVRLILPELDREEYASSPLRFSFADLFMDLEREIPYDDYLKYKDELASLSEEHPGFIFEPDPSPKFRNINITIAGDKMVIVSKEKSPTIHFVIYHRKMIRAFQNLI